MPLTDERWHKVKEIFAMAVDLPAAERTAALDKLCQDDLTVRREVESLLRADAQAENFMVDAVAEVPRDFLTEAPDEGSIGRQFGAYQVIREIGRGGLGTVYLAARADEQFTKHVAIKLVRRGLDTEDILRRFRNERQILAQLDHPNIARLMDGGTTAEGLPYFVMEYVEGESILGYCDARQLGMAERLQIFRKVCAAVTYAHQHLVIHRDLKPSNILVTEDGEPKLLDFGIAKLLSPGGDESFPLTTPTQRVMTPEYASPEQIKGASISTTSDVYSLGVLLFELLTGRRPYRLKTQSPDEIARAITDEAPIRPSTAVAKGGEDPKPQAPSSKFLRGDLDNVVLMALRKEPERRYSSVAQFSEDIRRYLENRPVVARKDTAAYRTAKFVARNKIAVAAAVLLFLTLIGGVVATAWQAQQALAQARIAAQQRDLARKQAAKADRTTMFLQNVLGFSDPSWASSNPDRKREATISEALAEAARRAERELAHEPEVLAAVLFTIGNSYRTQSRYPEAEPHLRAALDIRRRVLGPSNPETGQSMVSVAEWCTLTGRFDEAEPLFRDAIGIFRAADDSKWLAIALNDLGALQWYAGDYRAAEESLREALHVSRDFAGADRAPRAIMYSTLGSVRRDQGDLTQGAEFLQKAIEEHRALPGEPRSEMALTLDNLARVLVLREDYERAEPLARESFELCRKTLGENHQYTAYPVQSLADIYYGRGDYERARVEIELAMQIQQRALPPEHLDLVRSQVTLGKILMQTGELEKSESTLRAALQKLESSFPAGHAGSAGARGALGECLELQKRYDEAEPLLLQSHRAFESRLGAKDPRTQKASRRLFRLYQAWNKPDEATRYREP